ncbi:copper chaperone NosL [Paenibacillus cellulosilyticus]|uniref:Copper chaperone NosL n=1 Tax=Paenibacillus cellulosilyticus TaxID=375489 RepID=A0A2V2YLE4_9BACL|nr:nitrous oxide reductase accessory protein NosL [Paenibacillus cellulosilyticus]PWV89436.1 copper chaperone NosL [Paenibacillus cellulosilyticus]
MNSTKLMKLSVTACLLFLMVMLAGCGGKEYKAVAINEDTAKCAVCNMQVKDDAYATQLVTENGKVYLFDDIGCMHEWEATNPNEEIGASFVRDYNDNEWIKYEDAYYAYDASYRSPMAYGIYSFKDKESADAFVKSQDKGVVMTSAELASHSWQQNTDMMGGMDMSGHDESAHSEMDGDMTMDDASSDAHSH